MVIISNWYSLSIAKNPSKVELKQWVLRCAILYDIMNDIMKLIESLEWSCLLIKGVSETNKTKDFVSMILGTLCASLLENLLTVKGTVREGQGFQYSLIL